MIRDVNFVLATHGWQKIMDEEETSQLEGTDGKDVLEPLGRLGKRFEIPLEAAGADLSQLQKEFMEMLQYAISFPRQHLITRQSGGGCFTPPVLLSGTVLYC